MDLLTFIAELVKALAWPAAVLIIFLFLRKPILELIPLLQRIKYGGLEIDFGKRIQELAVEADQALPAPARPGKTSEYIEKSMTNLAYISPRAAVLEAWLELEEAAVSAAKRRGLNLTSQEERSPIALGSALERSGILDHKQMEIYTRLRNLRNAAAHATDFSFEPQAAIDYSELASRLAEVLRQA